MLSGVMKMLKSFDCQHKSKQVVSGTVYEKKLSWTAWKGSYTLLIKWTKLSQSEQSMEYFK